MKKIMNLFEKINPRVSFIAALVLVIFLICDFIKNVIPHLEELISSTDPFDWSTPWVKPILYECLVLILLSVFFGNWMYLTKRTSSLFSISGYMIGGLMLMFILGTIVLIILTKALGQDLFNLYLLVPPCGLWIGIIFGIILNFKKN